MQIQYNKKSINTKEGLIMLSFFATKSSDGESWILQSAGYLVFIALFLILIMIASLFRKRNSNHFETKPMVFSAVSIALATVTSMITIIKMPYGGSVTLLSMMFITLVGYWYGLSIGLTTAIAYGILQLILDPYILSIPQMLFDYIFAFGALGLSGLFTNKKHGLIIGYLVGVLGRYLFSTLSGCVFFAAYAPEGLNPTLYSLLYNGAYMGTEAVLTSIVMLLPPVQHSFRMIKKIALSS